MRIARVFPRKTEASPNDNLAFFTKPGLIIPEVDKVHISVTWTYDIPLAEKLARYWKKVAPVEIGGPALDDPGGDFTPGMYLKNGYVITSRGCPNKCWFCDVHRREGGIRELPITEGWNVLDSNLLACSMPHIQKVFKMLKQQKERIQFTGGLEAKLLTKELVALLWDLLPGQMFFAYDTYDDLEPLIQAGKMLRYANFTRSHLRCYVLIGYPKDTIPEAEKRLLQAWNAGFMPMAMLWKNKAGDTDRKWANFQRGWARPAATRAIIRKSYLKEHML